MVSLYWNLKPLNKLTTGFLNTDAVTIETGIYSKRKDSEEVLRGKLRVIVKLTYWGELKTLKGESVMLNFYFKGVTISAKNYLAAAKIAKMCGLLW